MSSQESLFTELFSALPRLAPGSDADTLRALAAVPRLPEGVRIADIGCGLGRSTLLLAEQTRGQVVAVDSHAPYLESLARSAREQGLDNVEVRRADMAELPLDEGSLDLLWAEGSIYIIGFARGLRLWRRFLRPGGWLAVTELSWLVEDPPEPAVRFWGEAYAAMTTVEENCAILRREGFKPECHFTLPAESWEADYYRPLERRLQCFEARHSGPEAAGVATAVREEIALFRSSGASYSYVFYIARRAD